MGEEDFYGKKERKKCEEEKPPNPKGILLLPLLKVNRLHIVKSSSRYMILDQSNCQREGKAEQIRDPQIQEISFLKRIGKRK